MKNQGKFWRDLLGITNDKEVTFTKENLEKVPDCVNEMSVGKKWTRPHDVEKEHNRVMGKLLNNDESLIISVVGLHKQFNASKTAVKCLSFGVNENECFGMLGHNGAGKTTAINMLTGLFSATSGNATINGYNIKTDLQSEFWTHLNNKNFRETPYPG